MPLLLYTSWFLNMSSCCSSSRSLVCLRYCACRTLPTYAAHGEQGEGGLRQTSARLRVGSVSPSHACPARPTEAQVAAACRAGAWAKADNLPGADKAGYVSAPPNMLLGTRWSSHKFSVLAAGCSACLFDPSCSTTDLVGICVSFSTVILAELQICIL